MRCNVFLVRVLILPVSDCHVKDNLADGPPALQQAEAVIERLLGEGQHFGQDRLDQSFIG